MQRFTLVCQDTYLFLSVYLLTMQIIKLFSLFPVSSSHKSHKSCTLWLKHPFIYLLCAKLFSNVFFKESLHCFSSYTCLGSHADVGHTATWCGWDKFPSIPWKLRGEGWHSNPALLSHAAGWASFWRYLQAYIKWGKKFASTANTNHFIGERGNHKYSAFLIQQMFI